MRAFVDLDIADGRSGEYEVKTDHPRARDFAGKNLLRRNGGKRRGKDTYEGIMHEKFKNDSQYKRILNRIKGDVLYVGMGLGLFAHALKGKVGIQDCVEFVLDIIKLCGQVFDTVFHADANLFIPKRKYDTIVIDCHTKVGDMEQYNRNLKFLKDRYRKYLKENGVILIYRIDGSY